MNTHFNYTSNWELVMQTLGIHKIICQYSTWAILAT